MFWSFDKGPSSATRDVSTVLVPAVLSLGVSTYEFTRASPRFCPGALYPRYRLAWSPEWRREGPHGVVVYHRLHDTQHMRVWWVYHSCTGTRMVYRSMETHGVREHMRVVDGGSR